MASASSSPKMHFFEFLAYSPAVRHSYIGLIANHIAKIPWFRLIFFNCSCYCPILIPHFCGIFIILCSSGIAKIFKIREEFHHFHKIICLLM